MKNYFTSSRLLGSWIRIAGVAALLAPSSHAAQFQFGVLVQAGVAGTDDWETGVGNTTSSLADTDSLGSHWVNGVSRLVQVEYLKATNTATVRVYGAITGSGYTESTFQPAGGNAYRDPPWPVPDRELHLWRHLGGHRGGRDHRPAWHGDRPNVRSFA